MANNVEFFYAKILQNKWKKHYLYDVSHHNISTSYASEKYVKLN